MCYATFAQSASWLDAEYACSFVYKGHLTDVANDDELEFISTLASGDFSGVQSGPDSNS